MDKREMHESWGSVAIIGMAGRFPGADDVGEFWQNICNGVKSISFFSDEEVKASGVNAELLRNANFVKAGGILKNIEMFDALFFGVKPREAEVMDPQLRLSLECAWEALESAGYDSEEVTGSIGVYMGAGLSTYFLRNIMPNRELLHLLGDLQFLIGNDRDFVATTLSYKLNLKGPSININTACSTSLVAIHLACQSLISYECDMALAGGVSIQVPQCQGYLYEKDGIYSPDGLCRAFDAHAQGTVGGNGVGIVVLKRLEEAISDGDCIRSVIKGSAINNDGSRKVGYTAPSIRGQTAVISQALAIADVHPQTIQYVETHGTGTTLGDPIEITALTDSFRESTNKKGFCAIGSVKTNVGHLNAAAGIAGLIKTTMALQNKVLPPSLHFERPNPKIDFDNSPFYVNTTPTEWCTGGAVRRAGVSSFGIGGTNAHVIVEECRARGPSGESRSSQLLVLSAKSIASLGLVAANLAEHIDRCPDINIADVAYTLSRGRRAHNYRRTVLCRTRDDALQALRNVSSELETTKCSNPNNCSVAFVFPGNGEGNLEFGSEIYRAEATFRRHVDSCKKILGEYLKIDLLQVLYPVPTNGNESPCQKHADLPGVALFVAEYSLAQLWISWGIRPVALIGHDIGEYVAACVAGVFTLEDALILVAAQEAFPGSEGIEGCAERINHVQLHAPSIPLFSGRTGQRVPPAELESVSYWLSLRGAPLPTIQELVAHEWTNAPEFSDTTFLEIGPHRTSGRPFNPQVRTPFGNPSDGCSETDCLLATLGDLWRAGARVDWKEFYAHQRRYRLALPTYPFSRQRYWIDPPSLESVGQYITSRRTVGGSVNTVKSTEFVDLPTDMHFFGQVEVDAERELGIKVIEQFDGLSQALNELCTSLVYEYLTESGVNTRQGSVYTRQLIQAQLNVLPQFNKFLQFMLGILEADGITQKVENKIEFVKDRVCIADADSVQHRLQAAYPQFHGLVAFLVHCARHFREALSTPGVALGVLYPNGSGDFLKQHLGTETVIHTREEIYLNVVKELVRRVVSKSDRKIRILEVGAGSGKLTWQIASQLRHANIEYHVTDIGKVFIDHVKREAETRGFDFIQYGILDISKELGDQGYSSEKFDLILGLNVAHATRSIEETVGNLKKSLAPHGIVALIESVKTHRWTNLIWGLSEAWWYYDDELRTDSPLLGIDAWEAVVNRMGFESAFVLPKNGDKRDDSDTGVILAQVGTADQIFEETFSVDLPDRKTDIADWFYVPSWKRSSGQGHRRDTTAARSVILVFADECYLGESLISRLRQLAYDVVVVRTGPEFKRLSDHEYCLRPGTPSEYDILIKDLLERSCCPKQVVHLGNVTTVEADGRRAEHFERLQDCGFFSLLFFAQSLGKHNVTADIRVVVVSNHMQEVMGGELRLPEKATVLGAVKVIRREFPNIRCRSVDIVLPGRGTPAEKTLLDHLLNEIATESSDVIVAYRGSHRWVQTYEAVSLQQSGHLNRLRQRGVYLITGGLGGIGLALAEHLARTVSAKLILVGRSPFVPREKWDEWLATHDRQDRVSRKIRTLKSLVDHGTEILLLTADVSNPEQIKEAIAKAKAAFGEIHGVIHSAGAPDEGGVILRRTKEGMDESLSAKVRGTLALDRALEGIKLDFLVLCSALGSVLYNLKYGEVCYVAANDFLNAFAHYKHTQGGTFTVAINWTDWQEVGMWADAQVRLTERYGNRASFDPKGNELRRESSAELGVQYGQDLLKGMSNLEGIEVFRRVLDNHFPQIVVSTQDLFRMLEKNDSLTPTTHQAYIEQASLSKPSHARPELKNEYKAPENETEEKLSYIWEELLGTQQIGRNDDFFDLGGDSLLALRVLARLGETFQVDLTLNNLFDAPTIAQLAERVATVRWANENSRAMNEESENMEETVL